MTIDNPIRPDGVGDFDTPRNTARSMIMEKSGFLKARARIPLLLRMFSNLPESPTGGAMLTALEDSDDRFTFYGYAKRLTHLDGSRFQRRSEDYILTRLATGVILARHMRPDDTLLTTGEPHKLSQLFAEAEGARTVNSSDGYVVDSDGRIRIIYVGVPATHDFLIRKAVATFRAEVNRFGDICDPDVRFMVFTPHAEPIEFADPTRTHIPLPVTAAELTEFTQTTIETYRPGKKSKTLAELRGEQK